MSCRSRTAWASVIAALAFAVTTIAGLEAATTPADTGAVRPVAVVADACSPQPCTWNFHQIKVFPAQAPGKHGAGVTVAVVDTWVDHEHPELAGRVVGHAYCVGLGGRCQANARNADECTHGTHVAGTVAAKNYGVAPNAGILAVQVLSYEDGDCSGSTEDVAAGIRYAAQRGADVINLSLGAMVPGLFQSGQVSDAVTDAARAGAVVVFAAGNSTVPVSDNYGANAVLVAATGPDGGLASYSSRGGAIDLAAPGGDDGAAGLTSCQKSTCVLSTEPRGRYALREGTSMAAPHVSGTAALLLAQHPRRGRSNVISTLRETARPLSGVRDGLIDADAALRSATETVPRTSTSRAASPQDRTTTQPAQLAPAPGSSQAARAPVTPPRTRFHIGPNTTTEADANAEQQQAGAFGQTEQAPTLQQPQANTADQFSARVALAILGLLALCGAGALWLSGRRPNPPPLD